MDLETLVYEKEERIATLTLNRPDLGNALSRQLRDERDLVLDDLDRDDDTRVLLIKGKLQQEKGVQAAVEDRDAPFAEHRTYWEAYQASRDGGEKGQE